MRVSQDVLEVLDRSRTDGRQLFLPPVQLDRKLYELTDKVLRLAGGKWLRASKSHVFPEDAGDIIEPILLTGEISNAKQEMQAFYTPPELATMAVSEAEITFGMSVLEPSAGGGVLARAAHDAGGSVTCVELNERGAATLAADPTYDDVVCGDFLSVKPSDLIGFPFDRAVMNPPFSKQQDARRVLHAVQFLKPGGRLVSIMSAAVQFRETDLYRRVRQLVDDNGGACMCLPPGSFRAAGTGVNTVLISFTLEGR